MKNMLRQRVPGVADNMSNIVRAITHRQTGETHGVAALDGLAP